MAMLFLLVLSGAFVWGIVNILRKSLLKEVDVDLMVVATMLGASVFAIPAQFIVLGVPKFHPSDLWSPLIGTIILNIAIQYLGIVALKMEDVSIVATLQGLTPIFLILSSWLMLREFPTTLGLVGIVVTVIGSYVLHMQGVKINTEKKLRAIPQPLLSAFLPLIRLFSSKGAMIALLTAILGAVALNFDKVVVLNSSPIIRTSMVFLPVALVVYLGSVITGKWQKIKKDKFWLLFGIGCIIGFSSVLMDSGFLFGIVPYVGSLKRFQIVVTAVLAGIFLHEKYVKCRIVAAVIIVIGIVLLYF